MGAGARFRTSWQQTEGADNVLNCFCSYAQPLLCVTLLNRRCLTCKASCWALNFPPQGRAGGRKGLQEEHIPGTLTWWLVQGLLPRILVYILQCCIMQAAENSSGTHGICALQLVSIFAFCGQSHTETGHYHHCACRQGRRDRAGYFSVCQVVPAVLWEEAFEGLPLLRSGYAPWKWDSGKPCLLWETVMVETFSSTCAHLGPNIARQQKYWRYCV